MRGGEGRGLFSVTGTTFFVKCKQTIECSCKETYNERINITFITVIFSAPFQKYCSRHARSTMADIDQLLPSVQSDFQLFGDLFENFNLDLHMPDSEESGPAVGTA